MWKVNNPKMHGLSEIGPNVPAFLIKLWKLVNSPETDDLICWTESRLSFVIKNPAQFSRNLLSLYYKHNNLASFIRQLNMYGFHKVVSESGGLRCDDNLKNNYKDFMEFTHQYFIKGHPYLLENIKRKLPNPKTGVVSNEQLHNSNLKNGTQSDVLAMVLSDVNNLKEKQESWDARLASMKKENEALWRELAIFRQKHLKQEQIINRLIHFIVTIVQPSRNVPLRRRYPLMLNDIQPVKKITKLSGADSSQFSEGSPSGPTIHEIDTSDVFFENSEQLVESSTTDVDFISSDLVSTPKFEEIEKPEVSVVKKDQNLKPSVEVAGNIPEDWLEIQLTEGNMIDPLTPVNPAKINPAVAAATLKHLEKKNNKNSTIAITLPSITASTDARKKSTVENRVILSAQKKDENLVRKNTKKKNITEPIVFKLDLSNSKGDKKNSSSFSSADSFFALVSKKKETSKKLVTKPVAKASKRKAPNLNLSTAQVTQTPTKVMKGRVKSNKISDKSPGDSFLKLESLYNGTISEDTLDVTPTENSMELDILNVENEKSVDGSDKPTSSALITSEETSSIKTETAENVINFEPDSMAVVCQNPNNTDFMTRELSSHVDSVQGEIDYLKEMLKEEGYNFDANTLPWLFSDDPLSYGVLPVMDEEGTEKKNEEAGVTGDELLTYGAPNLMDLVDMVGSTPSNQDWANVLSPSSSIVTDLSTPAPSPSSFTFPNSNKRSKM